MKGYLLRRALFAEARDLLKIKQHGTRHLNSRHAMEPKGCSGPAMSLWIAVRAKLKLEGILCSLEQFRWHFATILSELLHHLLVAPDVHGSRIVYVAGIMQFLCELLPCRKAAVQL